MSLAPATRLGPYEIVAPLGAGGMGEVYRAKDTRLGREVAIKVLPAEVASDPERLRRFEQEAKAVSALNHPHIVTLYEVGQSEYGPYLVLEKIEGRSVRELLRDGALPVKRVLQLGAQIAEGLAKAHAAGIVHRDLKPENVMVTDDGFAKILDFGLARLVYPEIEGGAPRDMTTLVEKTASGMILGTLGYLSPEQAMGKPADFRSDQFALGALLYEMSTGERPFHRETTPESLTAVIREEPEPLRTKNAAVPIQLVWIVERCLSKDPGERYGSTRDLARDLADLRDHLSEFARREAVPGLVAAGRYRHQRLAWSAAGAALLALGGLAIWLLAGDTLGLRPTRQAIERPPPTFQPLTFRRGYVGAARFSADGSTVVYSAAWNGEPVQPFVTRLDGVDSRDVGVPGANLLGVSRQGELALALNWSQISPYDGSGLLARSPLVGGALPREVLAQTMLADWAPDGAALAVVRAAGAGAGEVLVEYPVGRELYRSRADIRGLRVSPRGDRLALIESAAADWSVSVLDLAGKRTVLSSGWNRALGLAWARGGEEIWFTAAKTGGARTLFAVDLAGNERAVASFPGTQTLQDIAPDGTVLFTQETIRREMAGRFPGSPVERDLTWLDYSYPLDLSADGRRIVFGEGSSGERGNTDLYLRATDGGPALRLGVAGLFAQLSPDGRWIVASRSEGEGRRFDLIPTGAGESRVLDSGGLELSAVIRWMPDGKSFLFDAREPGKRIRTFSIELPAGKPNPLTPEGHSLVDIAPDGKSLLVYDEPQDRIAIQPLPQGEVRPISTATVTGKVLYALFSNQDDSLLCFVVDGGAQRIERLDLATGRHERLWEITPTDAAGVMNVFVLDMTRDGKSYVYSYVRVLSTLYAVRGLD